jgi:hypothetical protein
MPFKHRAAGSNPARLTKINNFAAMLTICAFGIRISHEASSVKTEGYGWAASEIDKLW